LAEEGAAATTAFASCALSGKVVIVTSSVGKASFCFSAFFGSSSGDGLLGEEGAETVRDDAAEGATLFPFFP
jgi:hypothetical protein